MGKIKEYAKVFASFALPIVVCIPLMIWYTEHEKEKSAARRIKEKQNETEYYKVPMVKNSSSFLVGYSLQDADAFVLSESIEYFLEIESKTKGIKAFDSLYVELCKHHCDSVPAYKFTNPNNRVFKCGNAGQFIILTYGGKEVEYKDEIIEYSEVRLEYGIPQKQSDFEEWEWCIINGKYEY